MIRNFVILVFALFVARDCYSEVDCSISLSELSPGVSEIVFPDMRVKLEPGSGVFKLKLIGIPGVVEDWTSAKIVDDQAPSLISGYVEKGGSKYLFTQVIVDRNGSSLDWAIYRSEKLTELGSEGTAYFSSNGDRRCTKTTNQKWNEARRKIFGETFSDSSGIIVPYRTEL